MAILVNDFIKLHDKIVEKAKEKEPKLDETISKQLYGYNLDQGQNGLYKKSIEGQLRKLFSDLSGSLDIKNVDDIKGKMLYDRHLDALKDKNKNSKLSIADKHIQLYCCFVDDACRENPSIWRDYYEQIQKGAMPESAVKTNENPNPQNINPIERTEDTYTQLKNEKQALEKQLREHILWYKPPPIEEEVKLKDLLPFVNDKDSAFRKKMKSLVLSLMKGYDNFKTETAVKWHENLKWYKEDEDESRQGVLYYKSKDGYDFCIAKVTFTGFDKEGKDIEIIAHQLFSDFTNTILGFKAEKIEADFLNSLLDIDRKFCTAIILYVGFVEKDITLMARYPAFSEDIKSLGNLFILNSRPWWRNAKDMKRREAFSWTDCIENQSFSIGISKPYQTIRADAPNERCLWIEVPIEDSAAMIIGIDLLKNDDF